ncbi:hypothetical protein BC936DRAFT_145469 [Jimgerdemannia flammicorona]|uniref:F-box domain-containing protein n=1 Tax=Jimgerdemannia flammicorona TaxID=994334 RepID=A0A433D9X1_9FUNG|nr:hypothetical protein BC936DRAFT_145469 [Jimgerdemannia flammicorona]
MSTSLDSPHSPSLHPLRKPSPSLPAELLHEIFIHVKQFSRRDVVACSAVCRTWHGVALPLWWERLTLDVNCLGDAKSIYHHFKAMDQFLTKSPLHCSYVQKVVINLNILSGEGEQTLGSHGLNISGGWAEERTNNLAQLPRHRLSRTNILPLIISILTMVSPIRTLQLKGFNKDSLGADLFFCALIKRSLLRHLVCLKVIDQERWFFPDGDHPFLRWLSSLRHLHTVHFRGLNLEFSSALSTSRTIAFRSQSLHTLILTEVSIWQTIEPLIVGCQALRSLEIVGYHRLSLVKCLRQLPRFCPQLEHLRLVVMAVDSNAVSHSNTFMGMNNIGTTLSIETSIEPLLRGCRTLRTLEVFGVGEMGDVGLKAMVQYGRGLHTLAVRDSPKLTGDGIEAILRNAGVVERALRHLDMVGCSGLRGELLQALVETCPNLHTMVPPDHLKAYRK